MDKGTVIKVKLDVKSEVVQNLVQNQDHEEVKML